MEKWQEEWEDAIHKGDKYEKINIKTKYIYPYKHYTDEQMENLWIDFKENDPFEYQDYKGTKEEWCKHIRNVKRYI